MWQLDTVSFIAYAGMHFGRHFSLCMLYMVCAYKDCWNDSSKQQTILGSNLIILSSEECLFPFKWMHGINLLWAVVSSLLSHTYLCLFICFSLNRNPPPTLHQPELWSNDFKDFLCKWVTQVKCILYVQHWQIQSLLVVKVVLVILFDTDFVG